MDRKKITEGLSKLLETHLNKDTTNYWSSEVSFLYDKARVDYMSFTPQNQSVSGIERGIFTAYEVKSCLADYKSENGHNFIGDRGYYVMTMDTYKKVMSGIHHDVGVYVAIHTGKDNYSEFENTTEFTGNDLEKWELRAIKNSHFTNFRKKACSELLFCMLRSGK